MDIKFYVVGFLVVIISTIIAMITGFKLKDRSYECFDFLFKGNDPILAPFSNTGTYVSLCLFFYGSFYAGFKYGHLIMYPFILASIAVFYVYMCIFRYFKKTNQSNGYLTVTAIVYKQLSSKAASTYFLVISTYAFLIIVSELFAFKMSLIKGLDCSEENAITLTVFIIIFCSYYVYSGGFKGVLWTDVFQLLIFMIWFILFALYIKKLDVTQFKDLFVKISFAAVPEETRCTVSDIILDTIALFIYLFAIIFCCIGFWVRTFGTLEKRSQIPSVIISLFLILIINAIVYSLGYKFHQYYFIELKWNFNFIEFPLMIIGAFSKNNSFYSYITIATFFAVTLTTIDSMILMILQNYYIIRQDSSKKSLYFIFEKNVDSAILIKCVALSSGILSIMLTAEIAYIILLIVFTSISLLLVMVFSAMLNSDIFLPLKKKYLSHYFLSFFTWNKLSALSMLISMFLTALLFIFQAKGYNIIPKKRIFAIYYIFIIYFAFNGFVNMATYLRGGRETKR